LFRKRLKTMKEVLRKQFLKVERIGIADKVKETDGVSQDSKYLTWNMEASKL